MIVFSHYWMIWLASVPVVLLFLHWILRNKAASIFLPGYSCLPEERRRGISHVGILILLRVFSLLLLVPLIAGARLVFNTQKETGQSSAVIVVLDISSSMTADDFAPQNRMDEVKKHLGEFISTAGDVELGLIVFAASPQLVVPVTADHEAVRRALEQVRLAGVNEDGTAIGSAIASAVNRLRTCPWNSRRILLITDGVNNSGPVSPLDAARIASVFGITIDAIGIGTDAISHFWMPTSEGSPVELAARIEIDDKALEDLTQVSGGTYHRVRNSIELHQVLKSLDRRAGAHAAVQPETSTYRWEPIFAFAIVLLLTLEFLLSRFVFLKLPG